MRWNTGIRSLLFLMWVSWTIIGQPGNTSAECSRDKLSFSFVRGHDLTMQDIVWVLLQGHRSVSISRHFLLQAYSVSVPCENSSAETTVAEGGRNPVAGLCGRTLSENWPPEPTFSYASIDFWCQLVASPATAIPETAKQRLSSIHANSSTDTYLWDRAECIRQYTSEAAHSKETYICRVSLLAVPVHIS